MTRAWTARSTRRDDNKRMRRDDNKRMRSKKGTRRAGKINPRDNSLQKTRKDQKLLLYLFQAVRIVFVAQRTIVWIISIPQIFCSARGYIVNIVDFEKPEK
ncbi:hypothetical protein B0H14DRAFT_2559648 [Mycena olivaceomarginata]|nr:hypothetical protein B0H14DRAFT_2559648 [Mycena olivaceomarginata]